MISRSILLALVLSCAGLVHAQEEATPPPPALPVDSASETQEAAASEAPKSSPGKSEAPQTATETPSAPEKSDVPTSAPVTPNSPPVTSETPPSEKPETPEKSEAPSSGPSTTNNVKNKVKEAAEKGLEKTSEEVSKIARQLDQNPRAKDVAAGVLQPIYTVAKSLAFPAFHWVAFALMAAGVVSYALQLALGKLVVLARLGFSLKEIASDAVGLAISVVGLVLTTQAAAENSTFTQSPAAVLSATAAGVILGIILYFWGQSQELDAVAGRSKSSVHSKHS
jgi:hypothetical protein